MDTSLWLAIGAPLALAAVVVVTMLVARRRRRRARAGREETLRIARQAIRQSRRDVGRRSRGSTRGKGYGGNDGLATDAGVTSESGGAP
ncbi:hypothetical protein AB0C04_23300 [Micromonospora sp. NPDC048909]|uniref:hypothetical protein n=1 Tax=Micromonospora sp. NPDC048909 TaxID=3155643 RepID=UPI0033C5A208